MGSRDLAGLKSSLPRKVVIPLYRLRLKFVKNYFFSFFFFSQQHIIVRIPTILPVRMVWDVFLRMTGAMARTIAWMDLMRTTAVRLF